MMSEVQTMPTKEVMVKRLMGFMYSLTENLLELTKDGYQEDSVVVKVVKKEKEHKRKKTL